MVNTAYPIQLRYMNKWTVTMYGLFFFGPLHHSFFVGHYSWKRGKLPRLTHNDMKYQKFLDGASFRDKLLYVPALEWYPDVNNRLHMKNIKHFLKKHRQV